MYNESPRAGLVPQTPEHASAQGALLTQERGHLLRRCRSVVEEALVAVAQVVLARVAVLSHSTQTSPLSGAMLFADDTHSGTWVAAPGVTSARDGQVY
jgi:hypothetical protein